MPRHPSESRQLRLEAASADLYASRDLHAEGRFGNAEFVLRRALKNLRGLSPGRDRGEQLMICLGNLVAVLHEMGRFAEAEAFAKEGLHLDDSESSLLNNLAGLYKDLDRYPEAEALYIRSLALRRQEGDPDRIARLLINLGDLRYVQARCQEAMALYDEGLTLVARDSLQGASLIGNMAVCLAALGRPREAAPYYQEAFEIERKLLGEDHPSVALSLQNLSCHLNDSGRPLEAREPRERALQIRRKVLGADHLDTIRAEAQYGTLLSILGYYREAQASLERWLPRLAAIVGPHHSVVASFREQLATVHYHLGQYRKARSGYDQARAIYDSIWAPNHPEVLDIKHSQVHCLCRLNLLLEAQELAEQMVADAGQDPPRRAVALGALVSVYIRRGLDAGQLQAELLAIKRATWGDQHPNTILDDGPATEPVLLKAIHLTEEGYGTHHPDLCPLLDQLAIVLIRQKQRDEEAEALLDRSLALAGQARGPNHHFLAETLRIRGRLRQSRGRCLEAEADFVRALRITEASDPPDPRDLEACLRCLAEHYRQRGEPERGS